MGGTCKKTMEVRTAHVVLIGKAEEQRPYMRGLYSNRLIEIGFGDMDWLELAQDRVEWQAVLNMVMKPLFSKMVDKFLTS
jgi:hypothetical protein